MKFNYVRFYKHQDYCIRSRVYPNIYGRLDRKILIGSKHGKKFSVLQWYILEDKRKLGELVYKTSSQKTMKK